MRCPACGAFYQELSERCPECGAIQNENQVELSQIQSEPAGIWEEPGSPVAVRKAQAPRRSNRSLIEFPGVNRSAIPQWRKELGERVREVHERRAREAILEAGGTEPLFCELDNNSAPQLELLPQAEPPQLNPIVVAALQRIERAHSQPIGNAAMATVAAAVVYEEQAEFEVDLAPAEETTPTTKPERVHNLAVVPTPIVMTTDIPQETPDIPQEPSKPRRLIDDSNDPALNYLDSVRTTKTLEIREYSSAPVYLRMPAALLDILVIGLLAAPFMALTRLTDLQWRNPRVIAFAAGTFLVVGFLYLTISIAFTGRTLGMKLFSLRVVDARTGLIPTGAQSAGRALIYVLTLASGGVVLVYMFISRERHTAHDRFTRTAVIRV
jgi:uncharacterized RDD family membrane protein YckC